MPSSRAAGLSWTLARTVSPATLSEKCAPEVCLHSLWRRAIRVPSCFLLYQNFSRTGGREAIALDCKSSASEEAPKVRVLPCALRLQEREVRGA